MISSVLLLDEFQEAESLRTDILEELVQLLFSGKCYYSRLLPTDSAGILTQQHYAGLLVNERMIIPAKKVLRPQEQLEEELELWAREHRCWWSEEEIRMGSDAKEMYSRGSESVVYIDRERQNVIKMMHPREGYDVESIGELLEKVALFNMVFSGASYEVIGYGYNDSGVFCAICRQPLITGKTLTRIAEEKNLGERWAIERYEAIMHKRGFEKTESSWLKDQYLVTDITGSNVVVTHDDYAIVVDADVNYREPSFFGEQHLTEN